MTEKQKQNFNRDFEELESISTDLFLPLRRFIDKLVEINECKNRLNISDNVFVDNFRGNKKWLKSKRIIELIEEYNEFEKSLER